MRVVVDTSVLVRALITPGGAAGRVLGLLNEGAYVLVYSLVLLEELTDVLGRGWLRGSYGVGDDDISALLRLLVLQGHLVDPVQRVSVCRDPEDDKVLEAAIAGAADAIVTDDKDLLTLGFFNGIPIIRPAPFLQRFADEGA